MEAIGAVWEVAAHGGWVSAEQPAAWVPVDRLFRDGMPRRGGCWKATRTYGPERVRRLVIATADPATLPEPATWYLETTLPVAEADLAEIVRLYGLRNWVEQAYKQVKHSLGWSQYQVRSDRAMRRHWALVQCAFAFCWWAEMRTPMEAISQDGGVEAVPARERGEKVGERTVPPGRDQGAVGHRRYGGCGPGWSRRCSCGAAGGHGRIGPRPHRCKPCSTGCTRDTRSASMTPHERCQQSTVTAVRILLGREGEDTVGVEAPGIHSRDGIDGQGRGGEQTLGGALGGGAEALFDLGEGQLDGVEVGRVGR